MGFQMYIELSIRHTNKPPFYGKEWSCTKSSWKLKKPRASISFLSGMEINFFLVAKEKTILPFNRTRSSRVFKLWAFEERNILCKALYIGKLSLPADVIQFSWLYLFMVELIVQNTSKVISKKFSEPCVSWN